MFSDVFEPIVSKALSLRSIGQIITDLLTQLLVSASENDTFRQNVSGTGNNICYQEAAAGEYLQRS